MMLIAHRLASSTFNQSRCMVHGFVSQTGKKGHSTATRETVVSATRESSKSSASTSWWTNPELWGTMTALSGWTMSISAIYDAMTQGPELVSLNMTSILIMYSSLFLRWSFVVTPRNLLLGGCHFTNICAQLNQGRRAIDYKLQNGQREEVEKLGKNVAMAGVAMSAAIVAASPIRQALINSKMGTISSFAASDAGPFRVHFWAPMSKWLISGASLMDLERPTDKISIAQYSSLSLCGIIHARYALTVIPTNYMLCSVNLALLLSSGWHLGRKLKADYIDAPKS